MIVPLINYEPFKDSVTEWEYAVENGYFDIEDVKEIFAEGRITKQELDYALCCLESEV